MILRISRNAYPAPVSQHLVSFRHRSFCVVRALRVYCRPKNVEDPRYIGLIEDHHMIHTPQRGDKGNALLLVQNGTSVALEGTHGTVTVYRDHEHLSKGPCPFKVAHVADVKNIETSVRKNRVLSCDKRGQFFQCPPFQKSSPWTA